MSDMRTPAAKLTEDGWGARGLIRFGLAAVVLLGGGVGTWAATASLSGAVIAEGQLRVESNRQIVQHPEGGVVGAIMVSDGDAVQAGDVLLHLDDTLLRSDIAALESQLYEIMARRGRLEADQFDADALTFDPELVQAASENLDVEKLMNGQRELFTAKREAIEQEISIMGERIEQLKNQIGGAESQLAALERQSELIGRELADQKLLLERGLTQASRVLALEREAARLKGEAGQLMAHVAQLRGQIAEVEINRLQKRGKVREDAISELRELGFRELELKQRRLAKREQLYRLELRAPRSGIVLDMSVHALNSVVRPAEPILYIVPSDTDLIIDAKVDPTHIDQIYRGQEAVLRFSAFNARVTPEILGIVKNVSPDVIVDEAKKLTFYRAEVEVKEGELLKLGDQALLPGMPVEVFIQTGKRTPLSYMLKPLTDFFNRAMREE